MIIIIDRTPLSAPPTAVKKPVLRTPPMVQGQYWWKGAVSTSVSSLGALYCLIIVLRISLASYTERCYCVYSWHVILKDVAYIRGMLYWEILLRIFVACYTERWCCVYSWHVILRDDAAYIRGTLHWEMEFNCRNRGVWMIYYFFYSSSPFCFFLIEFNCTFSYIMKY